MPGKPAKKKMKTLAKSGKNLRQVAALPYRINEAGRIELLLVTSRQTQRFLLPKGWPMKGRSDAKAALIEASEEAGISGHHHGEPIGQFRYWKRLDDAFVPVVVTVYPVRVEKQKRRWPEMDRRQRCWVSLEQAALLIDEPELLTLLQSGALDRLLPPSTEADTGGEA